MQIIDEQVQDIVRAHARSYQTLQETIERNRERIIMAPEWWDITGSLSWYQIPWKDILNFLMNGWSALPLRRVKVWDLPSGSRLHGARYAEACFYAPNGVVVPLFDSLNTFIEMLLNDEVAFHHPDMGTLRKANVELHGLQGPKIQETLVHWYEPQKGKVYDPARGRIEVDCTHRIRFAIEENKAEDDLKLQIMLPGRINWCTLSSTILKDDLSPNGGCNPLAIVEELSKLPREWMREAKHPPEEWNEWADCGQPLCKAVAAIDSRLRQHLTKHGWWGACDEEEVQ